ncbi:MAG: GNAT family N-acetyltransferase [Candidatus Promineifilaceae bacterium]|nr:GNAT family N-acetyltransferase [Candidatus Promineifilaceae bacterium]
MRIRSFAPADYEGIATVVTASRPFTPITAAELAHRDEKKAERIDWVRLVAEAEDGRLLGVAYGGQNPWVYHPQRFFLNVTVLPELEAGTLRGQLYEVLLEKLAPYHPEALHAEAREDEPARVAFLESRGFVESERSWESCLDPREVDLEGFGGVQEKLHARGVKIVTLAELRERDAAYARKLHELDRDAGEGEPSDIPYTHPPFEEFYTELFESPDLLPDAFFIALDGERYVGVSHVWKVAAEEGTLSTGFTGVLPDYRRMGIATALKVRVIDYAQKHGIAMIKTYNNQRNRPMLAINERLGFVKQPAWIAYKKELS